MSIINGQKYGLKSLIRKSLFVIKKNIWCISLVMAFLVWILFDVNDTSREAFGGLESAVDANNTHEKEVSGIAKVLDGDSIILSSRHEIRLVGIDAPEYKQKCFNKDSRQYACGKVSTNFLKNFVNGKRVSCFYDKKDIYKRLLGRCYLGDVNINNKLLRNGMAIIYSFGDIKEGLQKIEDDARIEKIGLWQGVFLEPRIYRKRNKNK